MKHILVPTDFSEPAKTAMRYALELASDRGALVTFFHSLQRPTFPALTPMGMREEVIAKHLDDKRGELQLMMHSLLSEVNPEQRHVTIRQVVSDKLPFTENVRHFAQQNGVDLIVMGSRGASGVKRLLFGSNTVNVIRQTSVPVLAVPDDTRYQPYRSVTVAVNLTSTIDEKRLQALTELAAGAPACTLTVLSVTDQTDEPARMDTFLQKSGIARHFPSVRPVLHANTHDDVPKTIRHFLETNATDLLVLMPFRRGFWEEIYQQSVTQEMTYLMHLPILVLPE
jgi:nucleotide-binding universal stress UspA family protein